MNQSSRTAVQTFDPGQGSRLARRERTPIAQDVAEVAKGGWSESNPLGASACSQIGGCAHADLVFLPRLEGQNRRRFMATVPEGVEVIAKA